MTADDTRGEVKPQRLQRICTSGWRLPEGAIFVGAPTRWANPVKPGYWASVGGDWRKNMRLCLSKGSVTREEAVRFFSAAIRYGGLVVGKPCGDPWGEIREGVAVPTAEQIRNALAGKDLVCSCPLDQPCHADVLLRIANEDAK